MRKTAFRNIQELWDGYVDKLFGDQIVERQPHLPGRVSGLVRHQSGINRYGIAKESKRRGSRRLGKLSKSLLVRTTHKSCRLIHGRVSSLRRSNLSRADRRDPEKGLCLNQGLEVFWIFKQGEFELG